MSEAETIRQVTVFRSESFVQPIRLINQDETSDFIYEWFTQPILLNTDSFSASPCWMPAVNSLCLELFSEGRVKIDKVAKCCQTINRSVFF